MVLEGRTKKKAAGFEPELNQQQGLSRGRAKSTTSLDWHKRFVRMAEWGLSKAGAPTAQGPPLCPRIKLEAPGGVFRVL